MSLVITNMTDEPFPIGNGVLINPKEQIGNISVLSPEMIAARDAGKLRVLSGDETLEERRADIEAINSGIKGDV